MDDLREERDELAALDAEADAERRAQAGWTDDDGLEWAQHVAAEQVRWNV